MLRAMFLLGVLVRISACVFGQSGTISTIAGSYPLGDGGPALAAAFTEIHALAFDRDGNMYILDAPDSRIRMVNRSGIVSTFAGTGIAGFRGDGGLATQALIHPQPPLPVSMIFDQEGNLYFSDNGNHRIRKISPAGIISTVAGNGAVGFSGDGGPARAAAFNFPGGLAFDSGGSLFVADYNNHRIRKIDPSGVITTIAGTGTAGFAGDGGPALNARLNRPAGIAFDSAGNLFVVDAGNDRIRRIASSGVITSVAGGGTRDPRDGIAATQLRLQLLEAVAVDRQDNFIVYSGAWVFRVDPAGTVKVLAGNGDGNEWGDGEPATTVGVRGMGIAALDREGTLYLASPITSRVRKVDSAGIITTVAGASQLAGDGGPSVYARVPNPKSIATDIFGNVYVTVSPNSHIKRISPSGRISVFASSPDAKPSPRAGQTVPATAVWLGSNSVITTDPSGNLYVLSQADPFWRAYKVTPDGMLNIVPGTDGGALKINSMDVRSGGFIDTGFAVDASGTLFVADPGNHRVVKVTPDGTNSVIAGSGEAGFSGDGGPATAARLVSPCNVAIDGIGNLFVSDCGDSRVRKITPQGIIGTVAGNGQGGYSGDGGPATQARLSYPHGIATDASGNLYIATAYGDGRIRKVTPSGTISTVAGNGVFGASGDGGPARQASLAWPLGVAADAQGNLYIADTYTHRVRKVQGSVPFVAEPANLVFAYTLNAPSQPQQVTLTVPERQSRPFVITSSAPWLLAAPWQGAADSSGRATVTITAVPAGLGRGTYVGRLTVTDPETAEAVVIPVTMTISGTPQQLRLSQSGLTFLATAGAGAAPQSFGVLNAGIGSMDFGVSMSTLSGGTGWLAVRPAAGRTVAGSTTSQVEVFTNTTGLAPGVYYGLVTVTAPGVDNSPQSAVVLLVVTPTDQPPGPVVDPGGMIFTSATAQTLRVSNASTRATQLTATSSFPDGKNWFTLAAASGTLQTGQTLTLEVRPNLQGIDTGVYRGIVNLRFQPDNVTRTVNLLLVVAPGVGGKTAGRNADGACTPNRLLPVFRSPGQGFSITAGWPAPVEVEVVDNCGQRMNTGAVTAGFNNNDPPLALVSIGEGRWTATWASRGAARGGNVEITARAQSQLAGEAKITGGVKDNPDQPLIAPGGVLNGASFRKQAPVAPGSYLSIFGTKLARELSVAEGLPLPLELGNTVVQMAGRRLPLHFTSDGQVNGILPYAVPDSTEQQMIVRKGTSYSLPETVLVAASEPAVFTTEGSGSGQGHVYVATEEGLRLADASRPARGGEVLVLYATGLGPVTPAVMDGAPAPSEPLSRTATPVTATIQGLEAEVAFAGLAPGYAGVYQVNIVVPEGLKADASAVLILNVGHQSSSPPVTFAVAGEQAAQ